MLYAIDSLTPAEREIILDLGCDLYSALDTPTSSIFARHAQRLGVSVTILRALWAAHANDDRLRRLLPALNT